LPHPLKHERNKVWTRRPCEAATSFKPSSEGSGSRYGTLACCGGIGHQGQGDSWRRASDGHGASNSPGSS
jgi:hypothetical protein